MHVVQVLFMSDQQLLDVHKFAAGYPEPGPAWRRFLTTATKRFRAACNCAAVSPDGQWIAVVGDTSHLVLMQTTTSCSQAMSQAETHTEQDTGQTVCQTVARLEFKMQEPGFQDSSPGEGWSAAPPSLEGHVVPQHQSKQALPHDIILVLSCLGFTKRW